jgi:hypothetical protein
MRATAAPNARRPPPHCRRGEPPGKPWSSYLSRALTPPASLCPVSPISLAFPKAPTHIPLPPFFSCAGNTRHPRRQPVPGILRPKQPLCELPCASLVLVDPLLLFHCSRSFVSDERRHRRLRLHRGQHDPSIPTPPQHPSQHYEALRPIN